MFIHEAVRVAVEIDAYIVRHKHIWNIRIKPTDSFDGLILITKHKTHSPRWQPQAEDLMADDWMITKEELI